MSPGYVGTSGNKGGSGAGFGFVVVAIVAAVAIGAAVKSQRGADDDGSRPLDTPVPSPNPEPFELAGSAAGSGWPKDRDGKPTDVRRSIPEGFQPVVWARLDFKPRPPSDTSPIPNLQASIVDEKGDRWPCLSRSDYPSVYFFLPQGYRKGPQHLTVKVYAPIAPSAPTVSSIKGVESNELVVTIDLPDVPPPRPLPPPKLTPAWDGIRLTPKLVPSGRNDGLLFPMIQVSGNVGEDHIVGVKAVGGSGSLWGLWPVSLSKGATSATLPLLFTYPNDTQTAYIEITERAPQTIRKTVTFADVPVLSRFGEQWIVGFSSPVQITKELQGVLGNEDRVPFHARVRHRSVLPFHFLYEGLVKSLTCRLLSPKHLAGTPTALTETKSFVEKGVSGVETLRQYRPRIADITNQTAQVEVQATVLRVVRHAVVAVDMTSALRQMAKPLPAATMSDTSGLPYFPTTETSPGRQPYSPPSPTPFKG